VANVTLTVLGSPIAWWGEATLPFDLRQHCSWLFVLFLPGRSTLQELRVDHVQRGTGHACMPCSTGPVHIDTHVAEQKHASFEIPGPACFRVKQA
jgi:hypothetical protein